MFKHPKCGGQHSTVAEARACEEQPAGTRSLTNVQVMHRPTTTYTSADGNVEIQVRQPVKHTPAQSAVLESLRGHSERAAQRLGYGLATSVTEDQRRVSINGPRRDYDNLATDPQVEYMRGLIQKRAWQGRESQQALMVIEKVQHGVRPTFEEARYLITELKEMPRKDEQPASAPTSPAPQGTEQRVNYGKLRALKAQVPDGRYAVDLPDGDKVKFFRLRTRKDSQYFYITHVVSDAGYPWPTTRYAEVLQAIIDATPAAAGKRFADEYGQCYRCGRALTDTNNPYKAIGLGPDCGSK